MARNNRKIKILGFVGSLRTGSYNLGLMTAAQSLVPKNVTLEIYDELGSLPHFNQDLESNLPGTVTRLKDKVANANALLFATPEYCYGVPGVLKNALDWAARPYGQNSWDGKTAAIMSTSTGFAGGARAQHALRQTFTFLNVLTINRPQVVVPYAAAKFDNNGVLVDSGTREKIQELLLALVEFTLRVGSRGTDSNTKSAKRR